MQKIILIISMLLSASISALAQENPEDLGKNVFAIFKAKDYETLAKLTPKADEALDFYKKLDPTAFKNEAAFKRKYISRDSVFIEKCIAIMIGKAGVDFKDANLTDIKYFEKQNGQNDNGEKLTRNYLEIYFLVSNKKYSLQFRDVRKFGNSWKLGESVRLKEEE